MRPDPRLLPRLVEFHAFDPMPLPGARSDLYLPFEQLVGRNVESALRANAEAVQRTAVVGPVGCGKSSLIEFAFRSIGEEFAPIWVSAAHENDRTVQQPSEFARHIIRIVVGWAREADRMDPRQRKQFLVETSRSLPARTDTRQHSFGLKAALSWLTPQYTREVTETLAEPEIERSQAVVIESLDRLVEVIHSQLGRVPVIIIDDSDRWLRGGREASVEPFFRETCRMLAERNWAVVLAIQPEYQEAAGFQEAMSEGYINRSIAVPMLPDPATLGRLLNYRIRECVDGAELNDVFTSAAIEHLYQRYANGGSLRSALTVVDQALSTTIDGRRDRIDEVAVDEAAAGLR